MGDIETPAGLRTLNQALEVALGICAILIVWDQLKTTGTGERIVERVRESWTKLQNCEGCARRREALRKATNRMMFEAEQTIEEAADAPGE